MPTSPRFSNSTRTGCSRRLQGLLAVVIAAAAVAAAGSAIAATTRDAVTPELSPRGAAPRPSFAFRNPLAMVKTVHPAQQDVATEVYPLSINSEGAVAGYYMGSRGHFHGFTRARGGAFQPFDVPGAEATFIAGITPSGTIAGTYFVAATPGHPGASHGFVESRNGVFETLDVPGAQSTAIVDIGPNGAVTGLGDNHGFVRSADGDFTTFDVANAAFTAPIEMAASGIIAGDTPDSGFVRDGDGNLTVFGASGGRVLVGDVNAAGAVCGAVLDPAGSGFVRELDGSLIVFTVPGALLTTPNSINSRGLLAGFSFDGQTQTGFVGGPGRGFEKFQVAGGAPVPTAISNNGWITGNYRVIETGELRGFIRSPQGAIETFAPSAGAPVLVCCGGGATPVASLGAARPAATNAVAALRPVGPAPVRGAATFAIELPAAGTDEVVVHDVTGRAIRTLESGAFGAGSHAVTWDVRDASGARVRPGIYWLSLTTPGSASTQRVVVVE